MTGDDIITDVRYRIRDVGKVGYSDKEILNYINEAVDFLNAELVSMNDPIMLNNLKVVDDGSTTLPDNFIKWAGQYPVTITGTSIIPYSGYDEVSCRYFGTQSRLTQTYHTVPFNDAFIGILTELATILALNRNEFDTTQDERRMALLRQVVRASRGAASG